MRLQISNLFRMERLAIKILILLSLYSCKAQQIDNNINSYYIVINKIISRDSISKENRIKLINSDSKFSNEQKNQIIYRISDEKSYIYLKQYNTRLKSIIEKELKHFTKYSPLIDFFGEKKIKAILRKFPKEILLDKNKLDPNIKIISSKNEHGHSFSSPIIIGDKMIIYHHKFSSKYDSYSEIHIYLINEKCKPKLIKIVHESIS